RRGDHGEETTPLSEPIAARISRSRPWARPGGVVRGDRLQQGVPIRLALHSPIRHSPTERTVPRGVFLRRWQGRPAPAGGCLCPPARQGVAGPVAVQSGWPGLSKPLRTKPKIQTEIRDCRRFRKRKWSTRMAGGHLKDTPSYELPQSKQPNP